MENSKNPLLWLIIGFLAFIFLVISFFAIPIHIVYRLISCKYTLWYYFFQIAISLDVVLGSIVFGSRHTLSACTGYRARVTGGIFIYLEKFINFMFGRGHCYRVAVKEGLIDA